MITHFKNIGLENFRVFKEKAEFDFAPITILTGTNSSGKSSLINAMEILERSKWGKDEEEDRIGNFLVKSPYVDDSTNLSFKTFSLSPSYINKRFGNFKGFCNYESTEEPISFIMKGAFDYTNKAFKITFKYGSIDNDGIGYLIGVFISTDDEENELIFSLNADDKLLKKDGAASLYVNYSYWMKELKKYTETIFKKPEIEFGTGFKNRHSNRLAFSSDYKRSIELSQYLANGNPFYDVKIFPPNSGEDENGETVVNKQELKKIQDEIYEIQDSLKIEDLSPRTLKAEEEKLLFNFYTIIKCAGKIDTRVLSDAFRIMKDPLVGIQYWYAPEEIQKSSFLWKVMDIKHVKVSLAKDLVFTSFIFDYFITANLAKALNLGRLPYFHYLGAFKASVQRIYLDYQTANDDFVKQITSVRKILAKELQYNKEGLEVQRFLNKSLTHLGIADSISITSGMDGSFSNLVVTKKNKTQLVADVGYGITQVLSFLFEIAICAAEVVAEYNKGGASAVQDLKSFSNDEEMNVLRKIIIVEEPEANLHPANQSKLVDIIVDAAATYGIQFIIETHSEYLIRKLQYLTAKGQIKPEDTQIYYFHPPDDVPQGEEQVKKINIQEDGSLNKEFGRGFFDEADNLAIDLYTLLTQNRKN
jgi:AAA15 family ATPase/GTPase